MRYRLVPKWSTLGDYELL